MLLFAGTEVPSRFWFWFSKSASPLQMFTCFRFRVRLDARAGLGNSSLPRVLVPSLSSGAETQSRAWSRAVVPSDLIGSKEVPPAASGN